MEDEGNLTVQNPSGRQPLDPFMYLTNLYSIVLIKLPIAIQIISPRKFSNIYQYPSEINSVELMSIIDQELWHQTFKYCISHSKSNYFCLLHLSGTGAGPLYIWHFLLLHIFQISIFNVQGVYWCLKRNRKVTKGHTNIGSLYNPTKEKLYQKKIIMIY